MKTVAVAGAIAAVSLGLALFACSSDDDSTSSSSSSSSSGTTGSSGTTPREAGTTSSSSGSEPTEVDTCTPAGGKCLCTCDLEEGTSEDTEKECEQPLQGTGGCPKVCCL